MSQGPESPAGGTVIGKVVGGLASLASAATDRAMSMVKAKIGDITDQLTEYAAGGQEGAGKAAISKGMEKLREGDSPVSAAVGAGVAGGKAQVKKTFGGGGSGGGDDGDGKKDKNNFKDTHIIETIEVGVPVWLAYNQWTQFKDRRRLRRSPGRLRCSGHIAGGNPPSSSRYPTSASCGSPKGTRVRSMAR